MVGVLAKLSLFCWGLAIALLTPSAMPWKADADVLGPGRHHLKLVAAGQEWTYHVQVPEGFDPGRPLPVVLILHGAGGSGDAYLDRTGWAKKADEAGFLAVAPDGLPSAPRFRADFWTNPRLWNTGLLDPGSARARVDDRAFFVALLDDLARRWPVDADRIYLTGHSNGGGMTFRLGTELSDRFAALAPVASHYWYGEDARPAHPRPTLYLVGTEDPFVPLAGGEITLPWGKRVSPPVAHTLDLWAKGLGCTSEPSTRRDDDGVKIVDYGPGREGSSLTAVFVARHGHSWPGGSDVMPAYMTGPVSGKVDATDMIWDFFRTKLRPSR